MAPLTIKVKHLDEIYDVDIDTTDSAEVFKIQLFSICGVEPSRMRLDGIPLSLMTDASPVSTLKLKHNQEIVISEAEPFVVVSNSQPAAAPASFDLSALQGCCTRIFLKTATIQPAFTVNNQTICAGCAESCHLPESVKPNAAAMLQERPFICECASVVGSLCGECLFSARVIPEAELLTGAKHDFAAQALRRAAVDMVRQQAEAGRRQMLSRIMGAVQMSAQYDDPALQQEALAVIPMSELKQRAASNPEPLPDAQDELLRQLLHWFKGWFQWVNSPPCDHCGSATAGVGATQATPEEQRYGAGMTEVYRCNSCGQQTRFPRYNHAGKLLQTRRGRCGEWAQAFTLCARAIGCEARFVNDWTDHVWTECWSNQRQEWIHCDSCEDAYDAPLMYESGWGKKLNYIIAVNGDEVIDVTSRYTAKWEEVLTRRTNIPESVLAELITQLNTQRRSMISPFRLQQIASRQAAEQAYLQARRTVAPPTVEALKAEEQIGRISGSEEWKRARGEDGAAVPTTTTGTTVQPAAVAPMSPSTPIPTTTAQRPISTPPQTITSPAAASLVAACKGMSIQRFDRANWDGLLSKGRELLAQAKFSTKDISDFAGLVDHLRTSRCAKNTHTSCYLTCSI
eukprot:TRINITY_DN9402_c0_g1_i2.p1 TRINITY_DN9402_c0_g1~~TRINITY_DN9402_c0_g1_i2.p1  ORF type:complete len:627 (-),score=102.53 TRINITY_DN9402_c0_g1_i2:482-2362(-)